MIILFVYLGNGWVDGWMLLIHVVFGFDFAAQGYDEIFSNG